MRSFDSGSNRDNDGIVIVENALHLDNMDMNDILSLERLANIAE